MKLTLSLAKAVESEVFRFVGMVFYPYAMTQAIESKKLRPRKEDVDISDWATQIMGLRLGDNEHRPRSIMMGVDYSHVDQITADRMREPIYIVETKNGSVIIDGKHRVAKAYMNGQTHLPSYIISQAQARKFGIMR